MYYSSRNNKIIVEASRALVEGIASDGGLFLKDNIPQYKLASDDFDLSYQDLTKKILGMYFDDFSSEEISYCVDNAYTMRNFENEFVEVKSFKNHSFLELFKGPTVAFKDMALTILPYLLQIAMRKQNIKKLKIITATSGDTGSAALAAFKDVDNIDISVLYPDHGISEIQEKQMLYYTSSNARAYSLEKGNFDDCQKEVKKCLQFKNENILLSSANSINIGRLVPQIVYYYYGYIQLVKNNTIMLNDKIDVIVPTGNFGNIFACYLAKKMGLPIDKLVCASNKNNILNDFFKTGVYDANREFYITNSPSMDILVSSNLERLLSLICSQQQLNEYMLSLKQNNRFVVDDSIKEKLKDFISFYTDESETIDAMRKSFNIDGYLIDPHTAVGYDCFLKYTKQTNNHCLIAATASYFKFPLTVKKALNLKGENEIELLKEIVEITKTTLPKSLEEVIACQTTRLTITEEKFEKSLFEKASFSIKVPASSANLACGFDVCGVSYDLFNEFLFQQSSNDKLFGFSKEYNQNNLVLDSYKYVFKKNNLKYQPISITLKNNCVPNSRGLGSSATCIVAGVLAANKVLNDKYQSDYLLQMMAEIEGHPDNVACCYLGQFVCSFKENQKYYYRQSEVSNDLNFVLCVPDYMLETSAARAVLPKQVCLADATYNASRLIQLPQALREGDLDLLIKLMDDKLHQPYRLALIPDADKIKMIAKEHNWAFSISGAGSTLLIIARDDKPIEILNKIKLSVKYKFIKLNVCKTGAIIKEDK